MRRNGFQWPLHPFQVVAWVIYGADALVFLLCLPLLGHSAAKLGAALAYGCSAIVLFIAAFKTTRCDAADPRVGRTGIRKPTPEELAEMPFCPTCDTVVYVRSKHCRACDKCVDVFDHHCMWLNNCVGRANYRAFLVTIASAAVMVGVAVGACMWVLIDFLRDQDGFEQRVRDAELFGVAPFEGLSKVPALAVSGAGLLVNGPFFLLDCQLLVLHCLLMSQGLTTYEYIAGKLEDFDKRLAKELKAAGKKPRWQRRRILTLPRCLDWIVRCRCGQRRRGKSQDSGASPEVAGEVGGGWTTGTSSSGDASKSWEPEAASKAREYHGSGWCEDRHVAGAGKEIIGKRMVDFEEEAPSPRVQLHFEECEPPCSAAACSCSGSALESLHRGLGEVPGPEPAPPPRDPQPLSASNLESTLESWARAVYARYNPAKLSRVEALVRDFRGREAELVRAVAWKYRVSPPRVLQALADAGPCDLAGGRNIGKWSAADGAGDFAGECWPMYL